MTLTELLGLYLGLYIGHKNNFEGNENREGSREELYMDHGSGVAACGCTGSVTKTSLSEVSTLGFP